MLWPKLIQRTPKRVLLLFFTSYVASFVVFSWVQEHQQIFWQ